MSDFITADNLLRYHNGIKPKLKLAIPYVATTNTAAGAALTGVCNDLTELKEGQSIILHLSYAAGSNATLNLTLADGSTTGAVNCYYSGSTRLGTHYTAGNDIRLTYHKNLAISGSGSYTGWWAEGNYDTNTVSQLRVDGVRPIPSGAKIFGTQLVFMCDGDDWRSITTSRATGTGKARCTAGIINPQEIFYYSSSTAIAVGEQIASSTLYRAYTSMDFRYSSNAGSTLAAHKAIYLVMKQSNADGLYYLEPTWWSQTLPSTADGLIYMYLGTAYSTYQIALAPYHPMYVHNGTKVVPYSG